MDDVVRFQFDGVIKSIDENIGTTEESFEKLLVALTGVFRLLDGKHSTLAALQGNPVDLQAYILKLLGQIREMVSEGYNGLKNDIQAIISNLETK
ncbi:MAG: hypothetical protein ACFFF4_08180 [Candidatus Thorarchaeota archaeon]